MSKTRKSGEGFFEKVGRFFKGLLITVLVLAVIAGGIYAYILISGMIHKVTVEIDSSEMGIVLNGDGEEVSSGNSKTVKEGDTVYFMAKENYGYVFEGWFVGEEILSEEPELEHTVTGGNVTLTARFRKDKFTVEVKSLNPGFLGTTIGEYEYLTQVTFMANDIAGTEFMAWYDGDKVVSADKSCTIIVDKDIVLYADYYSYGAQVVYTWPTAKASAVGTPLSEVELVGGSANTLGYFKWANPEQTVYIDGEYIVVFVPFATHTSELETMISVPIKQTVLDTPEISITDGVVEWDPVLGASGYNVQINGVDHRVSKDRHSYQLPEEMDEYFVSVSALGDDDLTVSSDYSNIQRYVPPKPSFDKLNYGQATSVYNSNGDLVKFGGTVAVTEENFDLLTDDNVLFEPDGFVFNVEIDITEYLSEKTKRKVLDLNKYGVNTNTSIVLTAQVKVIDPKIYAEIDTNFPFTIEDLAFGVTYTSMVTTSVNISINGEFVEPELRRGTLHLLFLELVGLEEPLYKWAKVPFRLKGTPVQVEFALCFDAVGAIAADMTIGHVEVTNYSAAIYAVKDGQPIFVPYFNREVTSNVTSITLDGELDVSLNFLRLSASLQLVKGDEVISVLRLNLDAANLDTDLSGDIKAELDTTNPGNITGEVNTDVNGSYYFYGQVTFEYYLEIKFKFSFLPLDDFGIKLLDGSYILAEWEYVKGGVPKTPYKDEAIHDTTSIFATDGTTDYYIDLDGSLIKVEEDKGYLLSGKYADLSGEQIVDIDDYYIYILAGNKLRRVGRTASTERTVLYDVASVVYSDRSYIYYTSTSAPNVVKKYYRSDIEAKQETFLRLPSSVSAYRMRYDYLLECYVVYAESSSGTAYYFSYDGANLVRHSAFEHAWWENVVFEDGSIAYYRADKNGNITECFIRGVDKGVTHADNAVAIGISPLGIFVTTKKAGQYYGYELGLYPVGKNSAAYVKIAEVNDPNVAKRIAYVDGKAYFADIEGKKLTVYKTDGKNTHVVAISELATDTNNTALLKSEIHRDWLFIYESKAGAADVIYYIDVETLDTAPYLIDGALESLDRGAPDDVVYEVGGNIQVHGIFINKYNDEEFEKITDNVKNYVERWNSISSFLDKNLEYWKLGTLSADDIVNYLNEYGDFLFPLDATIEYIEKNGDNLAKVVITVPASRLTSYSYGIHSGYIVTNRGVFEIDLYVYDSRTPTYSQDTVPVYDKGDPSKVSFEINLYDSEYSLVDVPQDAYEVKNNDGYHTFIFYPHFLSTLEYGDASIVIETEGEKFAFRLTVEDSRTPKDSEYLKHFDLTYPKNIVYTFNLYDEKYITSVEGNGIPKNGAYTISDSDGKLTLLGRYLNTLTPGDYVFTLTTAEKSFDVTLRVIRSCLPTMEEKVTHDVGTGNDLVIGFEKNDADNLAVYINGTAISDSYWRYSFVNNQIIIDNDYLLRNYGYGNIAVSLRSIIYSGDDVKSHVNNATVTLVDSRATKIINDDIVYVIYKNGTPSLSIGLLIYDGKVSSVVADGSVSLPFSVYDDDTYRKSAIIQINALRIFDVLSEGEHTLAVTVDGVAHNVKLTIRDERMPEVIGSASAGYNIDYPNHVSYIVRLYGERFISITNGGVALPDESYTFVRHSDNSIYHILVINSDYIESLGLGYSQTVDFVITTGVNEFIVRVVTDMDPTNVDPGTGNTPGGEEPTPAPKEEIPSAPVDVATSISVSPDGISIDKANVFDITFTPNYGSNNGFGSLYYGSRRLTEGEDYTFGEGNVIILKASFLKTLTSYGQHTVKLNGSKGKSASFNINVYDSRNPYLEGEDSFVYDKFEENLVIVTLVIYDSKVSYVRVGETTYTSGFSISGSKVSLKDALLDKLAIGEHVAYVGFNDTTTEIAINLDTHDTGLYLNNASVDKSKFADDEAVITLPWVIYEGSVEACVSDTLNVVAFDNSSVTLSGFASAAYKNHVLNITANGREFTLTVNVYDSRKPYAVESRYEFDKGKYKYSLNPDDTKDYDIRIVLELYDEGIKGLDMFSNQTINGNGIEYKDYEREGNDYVINYLYLHRLPVGTYDFYITTTDGDVKVTINITDSRAPKLKNEGVIAYDYESNENLDIEMELYGDEISSLSYIDLISGNRIKLVENVDYEITYDGDNSVLTLKADLFKKNFYDSYVYTFTLVSVSERTLDFQIRIENGPRRPFKITYYSVPWKDGEPEYSIESLVLYEGDMIPVPETPTYDYYNFLGFYTERTGGSLFNFNAPVTSDCDIFLHWEPITYTITLISEDTVIKTYGVKYLSDIPTIPDPTRAGYTFIKWTLDPEGEIRFSPEGETMPHRDITIYAQWQINEYTVIFKDKAGVVLKEETLLAYEDATPPLDEDMQIEHYIFRGWDKNYTSVLSDIVCIPVYEAIKYDITYNLNEGKLPSGAPLTYTIEGGVKLPTPIRTGYDFYGWYLTEDLTGTPVTSIEYGTLPGFTVYARFELATYDVYLNSTVKGVTYDIFGAPDENKLRITYQDEYTLPRVLVPNGYFFLGWYSGQNGTGTRFADYLGNSESPWSHAGNITLYAHVVSLLDFANINISGGAVGFDISTYSGAEVILNSVEIYLGGDLVASIDEEALEATSFNFADLFVESPYEIKVTYTYTIPEVEGERITYSSFMVKITDDSYPETVIGNSIAEIQVGNDVFASLTIDSITIMSGEEVVEYATIYYPGKAGSMLSDGRYWIYILDLVMNTEYQVIVNYRYTLNNYAGEYTSEIKVDFTTGTSIPGVMFPVASASSARVDDGSDSNYYYYTYNVSVSFTNVYLENNVRLVSWELLKNSAYVVGGNINSLVSGGSTSWSTRISRGYLSNGSTYQIKFTYTYDLQDGSGTQTGVIVHTFGVDTVDDRPSDCFVAGTDVLMADGSTKDIENVKLGDMVMVWDFYTGSYTASPVILIHTTLTDELFYLEFANGKRVGVGKSHGFYVDGEFVTVSYDNADSFIGKGFLYEENGEIFYTELLSVDRPDDNVMTYALVTSRHYNHFADGFLSVIPFMGLVNVFEYDGLKYDEELMARDLETYGYLDYDGWKDYVTEEQFYAFAGEYMNVAMGKGHISAEDFVSLIMRYFFDDEITM